MDKQPRSVDSFYVRTEHSIVAFGLFTDPRVWGDAKAFMAYVGRHLRGSAYRAAGLPNQKVIAEEHFGWGVRKLERVVKHLKEHSYLDTKKTGFTPGEFDYMICAPQLGLNLASSKQPKPSRATVSKPQTGAVSKPQTGAVSYNCSLSNPPSSFENQQQQGGKVGPSKPPNDAGPRAGEMLLVLEKRGVRPEQRAEIVACRTPEEITEWVAALPFHIAETGGKVIKSEGAILFSALRRAVGPVPRPLPAAYVQRRQLALAAAAANELADRQRATAPATAAEDPPMTPEDVRARVAAVAGDSTWGRKLMASK